MSVRLILLVAAACLSGCATVRGPVAPEPVTLGEVNAELGDRDARVYFADETFVRGRVTVGPVVTTVRTRELGARAIPTSTIATIRTDVGRGPRRGAAEGAAVGALPGLGLVVYASVPAWYCPTRSRPRCAGEGRSVRYGGLALAAAGALAGALAGAVRTDRRHYATVYRAPITRYPDAAAELRAAAPDSTRAP